MTTDNFGKDTIEVEQFGFEEIQEKFQNVRPGFRNIVEDRLDALGKRLIPIVKKNTPKASRRLMRSTKHRIIKTREDNDSITYDLQIIQDARGQSTSNARYHYWTTVHHGLHPSGKLTQTFPPPLNLLKWVQIKFGKGDTESKRISYAIARKIFQKGIPPNPYLHKSIQEGRKLIQQTSNELGQQISIDLTDLPEIKRDFESEV